MEINLILNEANFKFFLKMIITRDFRNAKK